MANERLGASFSIDVTQLKAGLAEANRLIKESKSEFKAAAAGLDDWSKSEEGLNAKLKSLNTIADIQSKTVNALQQEYDRLIDDGLDPTSAQAVKLRTDINNQKAALGATQAEIKKYNKQLDDMGNESEDASDASDDLEENVTNAGNAAEDASDGFTVMKGALANLVTQGINLAVGALKDFASDTLEVGKNFDASMSSVAALSGATGEELEMLRDTAKEFGSTTKFSASEAADALGYMALAGWDAEQSASSLGGVLNLAAASNMDLAEASDMVTDYLSAFGMEADDSAYFADLLAFAQANANTTAAGLGEAYKNCAANMNAAGQDIETTTALLSMMANQGLKGSEAGTALTAMMRDMTAKMENGKIAIGDTTVAVMDANGNYRDMTDILADVEAATDGMGDAERAAALSSTFTSDSIKGLNLVLNAGVDNAADFEDQLRNSSGAAAEMSAIMQDNLQGDLSNLSSAFEGLQLAVFEGANVPLRGLVQQVSTELIPALTDFVNGVEGSGARVGEAVGNIVNNILTTIVDAAPQMAEMGFTLIMSLVQGIISSLPSVITAGVDIILALIDGLGETIPQLIQQVIEIVPQIVQALANAIPELIDGAIQFFMAIIQAIPTIVDALVEALPQIYDAVYNGLLGALPQIFEGAIQLLNAIIDAIPAFIPLLTEALPQIIETIIQAFIDNFPVILEGAIQLFMALVQAIPVIALELVKAAPQIVTSVLGALVKPIANLFSGLWDGVKKGASALWNGIKNVFSVVGNWFNDKIIKPVSNFFGGMWDKLKKGAAGAWEGIKNIFSSVATFFGNIFSTAWQKVKNVFSVGGQIFSGIKDGIINAFKAVVNTIIRGINTIVAIPFNGLNGILNKIQHLSFLGISPFSFLSWRAPVPQIPQLARGGVVKEATTAVVGEAGEEAIVPLERNTEWIKKVAQEIAAEQQPTVNVYQTNNYSQAHSRYELYKSKQQTAAAIRLALAGV
ncbi:MAG: phage tail tape measure protein [Selenomonadaceae bacterium]|nr:phage tail tape measure protein [Selenomonadaceae bacterium]